MAEADRPVDCFPNARPGKDRWVHRLWWPSGPDARYALVWGILGGGVAEAETWGVCILVDGSEHAWHPRPIRPTSAELRKRLRSVGVEP
jgi:hypothetical protein